MNQEIKKNWITALRSGEYKQGKQWLHDDDSFCCLGVLTDLYLKEHNVDWDHEFTRTNGKKDRAINFDLLPVEVSEWSGLRLNDPKVPFGEGSTTLSDLNDDMDKSFEELSEIIDSHF